MNEEAFRAGMKRVAFYAGRLERLAAELRREFELFDSNPEGTGIGDLRETPRRVREARETLGTLIIEARDAGLNVSEDTREEGPHVVRVRGVRYRRARWRRMPRRRSAHG